ncbi:Fe-S cluster assembly protein SufD [Rickettsiella grylli]|uniref:Fe-S cluster assembly protein SufD n=1 Tax=Rickettsiella grylli TaxID=59196 RepID=UPI0008FD7453|nr:Fe-S cluster assembly protein SufD [Rickettsiella grylli]OIZ99810.1 Fe-S cluster assembly protein SufD [Rickettsiella grylli]
MLNKRSDFNAIAHYSQEYQRTEKNLFGQGEAYLTRLRRTALDAFTTMGFPSKKQADWKYTSFNTLHQTPYFLVASSSPPDPVLEAAIGARLVFVNGFFAPHLSTVIDLARNDRITHLIQMHHHHPELVKAHVNSNAVEKNSFTQLNTAFLREGAFIYLPANTCLNTPIDVLFINTDETPHRFIPLRNIIIAEENSQATIVEKYIDMTSKKNTPYFTNSVTECYLSANSHIEHYQYINESQQAQHVGSLSVSQQANSQFSAYSFALNGALIRRDIIVKLLAPQAQCQLKGLYLAFRHQQIDYCTVIDHVSPKTQSDEFYKGIIGDHARATFNGKLIVREDAIQSKAHQLNKNLLLSAHSEMNSKPQLELFTDDIHCTHGASIGQLDNDALFYLQSRGLTINQATDLLVNAFAHDILQHMPLLKDVVLPHFNHQP